MLLWGMCGDTRCYCEVMCRDTRLYCGVGYVWGTTCYYDQLVPAHRSYSVKFLTNFLQPCVFLIMS